MHYFTYKNSELFAEDVSVRDIVNRAGTPLYIYSHKTITRHLDAYMDAFNSHPNTICYAVKANPNPALLRIIAKKGG
ncbi:MAG TPA: diaminopimelate decarboxylase, partial [Nitrospirae bacterium]|nr:diaminopimelate decarboxylase [Nitrospirota bacterium]